MSAKILELSRTGIGIGLAMSFVLAAGKLPAQVPERLPVCYRVTELVYTNIQNSANDVYDIYPIRLTDAGTLTGYIYHTNGPISLLYYSPAAGFLDLGRWNGLATRGFGLNLTGQIAVRAWGNGQLKMLRYTPGAGYQELGTLGGNDPGSDHDLRFINSQGQVTGFSETPAGEIHAFRWTETGGMEDLGTLGGWWSKGLGINSQGWVSGTSLGSDGEYHAFVQRPSQQLVDLGLGLGGDINNRGVVIGAQPNGLPMLVYDGKPVPITPNFGIANYSIGDLNEHNIFMGTYWDARLGVGFTAIIGSEAHGIVDLNTLIPTNSGWILAEATGLNNKCQVVGKGIYQGRSAVFCLDPIIPALKIRHSGTNVALWWAETFFPLQLEESATLNEASWQALPGLETNFVTLPMAQTSRFYRLTILPPPPSSP